MECIYDKFVTEYPTIHVAIQETKMNEAARENFLMLFQEDPEETFIAFCVLGGIFSEGIDLKGTRLIGTIIVGIGLPQMNNEQELIKTYYEQKNQSGFQFAYQIPGMNKVLQASGRVIRGEEDKGVILLLDQRFSSQAVQQLFPPHWESVKTIGMNQQLANSIQQFWQQK